MRENRDSTTYGVYGIVEWVALIPVGRCMVRVHFKGGSMTGYGVTPATFTTSDRAMKAIIERSAYYANRKIVKVR